MNIDSLPLVSIIITSFNHEKYLDDCIGSVINQAYTNLEILIVDNNSSDNSSSIISEYTIKDKRIKFYPQKENLFPSAAINLAIRHAKGEYISMISGDDYCELNKIEIQLDTMLKNNFTNLFSWVNIVDDTNTIIENHPFNGLFNREFLGEELEIFLVTHGNTLCAGSVLLHKSFVEKYGYFDNRLLQLQDYEMWLRLVSNEKINVVEKKLFNYRVRNDNKNLSLNNEDLSVKFRSSFESVKIVSRVLLMKNQFLTHLTGIECNDNTKHKNLFNYYMQHNKTEFANGIMLLMFDDIDNKSTFPSQIYADFLEIYSKNDLFNFIIKDKMIHEKDKMIHEKDKMIHEKDKMIHEKDKMIHEKDKMIQYLENLAQSLRLKNRAKNIIKKLIPSKIWNLLRYIKNNPSSVKMGLYTLKTKGLKEFINKLSKVQSLSEDAISCNYKYASPLFTESIKEELAKFEKKPLISIIIPVYNVDPKWLELAIKSIENQWYENWEICIVDDKSTNIETLKYLNYIDNSKIKIKYLEKNLNISGASNAALSLANGEYIGLMDNDDEITVDALYEVVKVINQTDAEFIYSDEDKLEMNGDFTDPHFKPDFAPDMFLSQNYISHFGVIKKDLIDKAGGFTVGLEGAQDYDLYLKILEHTNKISHISKVLYHWRKIPGSTAADFSDKSYAQESGRKSIENALIRKSINAKVLNGKYPGTYKVEYILEKLPLVSIIIPFKDKPELLKMCIDSILEKSTYKNFEIIGISNNSSEKIIFNLMYEYEEKDKRIKFYEYNIPFNYSQINNFAVNNYCNGEHIILLNNDIEIITPSWIEEMLMHSQREEIGCVGAKLYYPNDTIQHAGVIIGIGGIAGHSHKHFNRNNPGYISRLNLVQNFNAVTAACLMVKTKIFKELNGLNEENLKIAFNDVDFCLRVKENGYRNIFTPYCEAYHHESISRGHEDSLEKVERFNSEVDYMKERHNKILVKGDPYYNVNLTLHREDFSLRLR